MSKLGSTYDDIHKKNKNHNHCYLCYLWKYVFTYDLLMIYLWFTYDLLMMTYDLLMIYLDITKPTYDVLMLYLFYSWLNP
jgi:hypothetical protein